MYKEIEKFSRLKFQHLYRCIGENDDVIQSGNIRDNNSIGDVLEEIFADYMCKNITNFKRGPKQKSPDFFYGDTEIELKVFKSSPGFDIGNFYSYIHSLSEPGGVNRKLNNTLYVIFEYDMEDDYIIIKNHYIKRVWEIVSLTTKYPVSCQVKYGKIHNLRPTSSRTFKVDNTSRRFMESLIKLIQEFPFDGSERYIHLIEQQLEQLFDDWRGCHIPK